MTQREQACEHFNPRTNGCGAFDKGAMPRRVQFITVRQDYGTHRMVRQDPICGVENTEQMEPCGQDATQQIKNVKRT